MLGRALLLANSGLVTTPVVPNLPVQPAIIQTSDGTNAGPSYYYRNYCVDPKTNTYLWMYGSGSTYPKVAWINTTSGVGYGYTYLTQTASSGTAYQVGTAARGLNGGVWNGQFTVSHNHYYPSDGSTTRYRTRILTFNPYPESGIPTDALISVKESSSSYYRTIDSMLRDEKTGDYYIVCNGSPYTYVAKMDANWNEQWSYRLSNKAGARLAFGKISKDLYVATYTSTIKVSLYRITRSGTIVSKKTTAYSTFNNGNLPDLVIDPTETYAYIQIKTGTTNTAAPYYDYIRIFRFPTSGSESVKIAISSPVTPGTTYRVNAGGLAFQEDDPNALIVHAVRDDNVINYIYTLNTSTMTWYTTSRRRSFTYSTGGIHTDPRGNIIGALNRSSTTLWNGTLIANTNNLDSGIWTTVVSGGSLYQSVGGYSTFTPSAYTTQTQTLIDDTDTTIAEPSYLNSFVDYPLSSFNRLYTASPSGLVYQSY